MTQSIPAQPKAALNEAARIQFSHQIIHKAVLRPRHPWSSPIWVLRGETQIYIAQAAGIKEALAFA